MNNLKDIHNKLEGSEFVYLVVLSGFQWTIWRIYTTICSSWKTGQKLFYQDFNEQFEGYTQLCCVRKQKRGCCFIRISMNNLKDIHNLIAFGLSSCQVVLSGFQWTIWRIYTTLRCGSAPARGLFYQDFNEQFEGYTQLSGDTSRACAVVLSGFQWTIWRIYTTLAVRSSNVPALFYQDFNEQFEGYTQH